MISQKTLKNHQVKVSFQLAKAITTKTISIVGDFNNWNPDDLPMTQTKGKWWATQQLEPGHYEFRYLLDKQHWLNDDTCKRCLNPFGTENSVLVVQGTKHDS